MKAPVVALAVAEIAKLLPQPLFGVHLLHISPQGSGAVAQGATTKEGKYCPVTSMLVCE